MLRSNPSSSPYYIPLPAAARIARVSLAELRALIEKRGILVKLEGGEPVMSENDIPKRKEDVPEYKAAQKKADELVKKGKVRGRLLGIAEAARVCDVVHPVVSNWIAKGYVLRRGTEKNKTLVDLGDVLYCKAIHDKRGGKSGAPLLNADGTPYVYRSKQAQQSKL